MKFNLPKILEHWPAKVLALCAALLLFLFNRIDSMQQKTYNVPLRLVTDSAMVPAENYFHRVKITLRGPEESIAAISEEDIEAVVDFSNRQSEGLFHAPIQILKKGALAEVENLEVAVDPLELPLRLERKLVKTVKVQASFLGQPGRNFELSSFVVTPAIITVEGPRSKVEKMSDVHTEPLDLRGKTDDFSIKVKAISDSPLISFPYGSTVEIQGTMKSSLSSMLIEKVVPQVVNLGYDLTLKNPIPPVNMKIRGTPDALKEINTPGNQPSVIADLTGYTIPGEVPSLTLRALLPPGIELVEISPPVVSLFLEHKP